MQYTPYTNNYLKLSNGNNIAYIDEGEGDKTLLFIHGLASYSLSWKKNIEQLKNHFRCIAIDLPGNGMSDRGDFPYGINFFAGAVYDFIQKLGLKNLCLVGHSMGGQIAITMLLNAPHCANQLILCAPAGFEVFTPMEKSFYHSSIQLFDFFSSEENSLRKTIQSSFYHYPQQADEMADELVAILKTYPTRAYRDMIDKSIAGMLNEPVFNGLHLITQPTLVMFGERDALIPNRIIHPTTTKYIATEGAGKMPNATLKMISKCGHFLQWEKAGEVNDLIIEFLQD
ncbi:MAG TPA: alpha/beta hydrolase [Flavipsychrobacter sp.]|nr:alpha/beta hydrolase [Flavipsychrobacter sp.]